MAKHKTTKKADPVYDDTHATETHGEDTVPPTGPTHKAKRRAAVEERDPDAAAKAAGPAEYPKRVYGKGRAERTVVDAADHKRWAAKGYKDDPSEAHLHEPGVEY